MSGLSPGTFVSNLKSVALTISKLLAFNAQKFNGHVTLATPPFGKIFKGHVRTVPGNTSLLYLKSVSLTVLELFAFNARFELVWLTVPLRTHRNTDTQNHIERTRYLRHSLRSLGGDNNNNELMTCKQSTVTRTAEKANKLERNGQNSDFLQTFKQSAQLQYNCTSGNYIAIVLHLCGPLYTETPTHRGACHTS